MELPMDEKNFLKINAGKFPMGDDLEEDVGDGSYKRKRHNVTLTRSFYMNKYPVTQTEYERVMGENPSYFLGDNRPVDTVRWEEAIEFCNKASLLFGFTPAYIIIYGETPMHSSEIYIGKPTLGMKVFWWNKEANGFRLPTEAEWEYACRAGETGTGNTTSNYFYEHCWYKGCSQNETKPVGQKKPNNWGLYDMQGNVYEWCWDVYKQSYPEELTDPVYDGYCADGNSRVTRGGSWDDKEMQLYMAARNRYSTNFHRSSNRYGFRIVSTIPTQGSGPTIDDWKTEEARIIKEEKAKAEELDAKLNKKSGPCFITTAVCSNSNKPDNCYELISFRKFRDEWLVNQYGGKKLVDEYYRIAPVIVDNINKLPNKENIYTNIWYQYLSNCLNLIESNQYNECKNEYIRMVNELKKNYFEDNA